MSEDALTRLINDYSSRKLILFLRSKCDSFAESPESLTHYCDDKFSEIQKLGEIRFSTASRLVVVSSLVSGDLNERSGKRAQYEKAKKILKEVALYDAGFFVFYDSSGSFRFSLIYAQFQGTKRVFSNFRRFTYFVSKDQTNRTFRTRIGACTFSSLETVKDAFSVEKVNKEFYTEIAKYYYRLTGKNEYKKELVLPSVGEGGDRKFEEYAVRLIGRIIFCWFLKHKKSMAGVPLILPETLSVQAVKNQSDYYHSILELLFFEVMNKPAKKRKHAVIPHSDIIPFLNGGLFEPHINDYYENKPNYALKIPDSWFVDFLSVLEQYNFTIDENSTVDADVSVDPEMLGRIFENLLAEVVPETGESARKATGSYYTPRAIVDYMVEQSLRQHLLEKTKISVAKIDMLLSYELTDIVFSAEETNTIIQALKEIKVIDPACGSGAFPMGILHRMLLALEKIDPKLEVWRTHYLRTYHPVMRRIIEDKLHRGNQDYIRKLIIIQDSIYGVDIQPIAVEIAKLRCFLSLIVDELVLDDQENRGIEPLPNLEFKFVSANTLIGLPSAASQYVFGITELVGKLKDLRASYLRSFGDEKLQIEEEFKLTQQKLFKENIQWAISDSLVKQLTDWDPFSYASCGWFDPGWMFGVEGGFDIVIANPPYIDSELMVNLGQKVLRETIQKTYKMTKGNWDIYIAFFECGFNLLNNYGVLTYITPDKWISKPFGDALRMSSIGNMFCVLRSGREVFESSNVDSIISFFSYSKHESLAILDSVQNSFVVKRQIEKSMLKPPFALDYLFSDWLTVLFKIDNMKGKLADLAVCENACATSDAYKLSPLIKDLAGSFSQGKHLKIVNTGTISKYAPRWGNHPMTYLGHKYLCPVVDKIQFQNEFRNSYGQKSVKPKIIIKGLNLLDACLDFDGSIIPGKSTLIIEGSSLIQLKLLLSIVNSRITIFYLKERYPASSYNLGTSFTKEMINTFPVPLLTERSQDSLVGLVDRIFLQTEATDYFSNSEKQSKVVQLQSEIDQILYKLYELNSEEISVICSQ